MARQNQRIKQCRNRKQCASRQRIYEDAGKLRRIDSITAIDGEF